jgi:hypothetical protein
MPAPARRGGLEEAWERGEAAGLRVRSFRGTTFRGAAAAGVGGKWTDWWARARSLPT